MSVKFVHHVTYNPSLADESNNALSILCASLNTSEHVLSAGQIKQAISQGALWLTRGKHTQRLRRVKKSLLAGDTLHFYYNETVLASTVESAILISDEQDYSVWYKPYGMLSQGSKWSDHCTIGRYVQQHLSPERSVFVVHRLDRAASGLILIAHSKKAASALSSMFEKRTTHGDELTKIYQIIVHGDHRLNKQPQVIKSDVAGKSACSTFTCLAYDQLTDQSLIKVKIDSGRKHQIRVHAAHIGLPVVGDRLHGIADKHCGQNLQLCAVSLAFTCPLSLNNEASIKQQFELPDSLKLQF